MMITRLRQEDPELAVLVQHAGAVVQEALIGELCSFLATRAGWPDADALPSFCSKGIRGLESLQGQITQLAKELDGRYLDLHERGAPEALNAFSRARAAAGLSYLAIGNLEEAIYEAMFVDDEGSVRALVHQKLGEKRG